MVKCSDKMVQPPGKIVKSSDETHPPLLGVLLATPFRAIDERVHEALQAAGYTDVRPAHHVIFRLTGAHGTRLSDLVHGAAMTKQSVNYLVDHLEAAGYIERVPDPTDRRAKLLQLTERGRDVERVARRAIQTLQTEWAAELGESDFETLLTLLRRLYRHVQIGG